MAFRDVLDQHARRVFLNPGHFAREWTRWPLGLEDDAECVEAVFEPERIGDRLTTLEQDRITLRGVLTVAAEQSIDRRDTWVSPEGHRYQIDEYGDIDEGLRDVRLKRLDRITTSKTPRV